MIINCGLQDADRHLYIDKLKSLGIECRYENWVDGRFSCRAKWRLQMTSIETRKLLANDVTVTLQYVIGQSIQYFRG